MDPLKTFKGTIESLYCPVLSVARNSRCIIRMPRRDATLFGSEIRSWRGYPAGNFDAAIATSILLHPVSLANVCLDSLCGTLSDLTLLSVWTLSPCPSLFGPCLPPSFLSGPHLSGRAFGKHAKALPKTSQDEGQRTEETLLKLYKS